MLDIHDKKNSIWALCQGIEKREREEFKAECARLLEKREAISLVELLGENDVPCIAVYPPNTENPCDFYVHLIMKNEKCNLFMRGQLKDGWYDEDIMPEDVMTGHLSWVTDELRLIINT